MIRDALNTIRSGRSLKDKDTKIELESYVDRLSRDERGVLYTFLNSISDIMTDMVAGQEAQDPSEPPSSFTVKKREEVKVSESENSLLANNLDYLNLERTIKVYGNVRGKSLDGSFSSDILNLNIDNQSVNFLMNNNEQVKINLKR